MSYTITATQSAQTPQGTISGSKTATADAIASIDATLTAASNVEYDIDFKYAQLKMLVIKCAVACTIKTNSSSEPDQTITIVAGEPFLWVFGGHFANPITADVSKVYITAAAAGLFQMVALHDPTA